MSTGAHFSSEELARVLSHYRLGVIHKAKPLSAGSKRTAKIVITSKKGKFLLKRRAKGKSNPVRIAFAHAVQTHLSEKRFPVPALLATCDENNTTLALNNHVYECFRFVVGERYNGSAEATLDAGRQLANFHKYLADFEVPFRDEPQNSAPAEQLKSLKDSFHDSTIVRRHLKTLGSEKNTGQHRDSSHKTHRTGPKTNTERHITEALTGLYNSSSIRVNELGFDSWGKQVVHGDWHQGNMLFSENKVTAVLDFDSVKIAPPVTDLANGMLQISIVGDRPNPADWPAYLDQAKLVQFLDGYREVIKLDKNKLDSLLDLMIETMIAEAVLPVAATGFFGNLTGVDFLKMIQRKAKWLNKNRKKLTEAMDS